MFDTNVTQVKFANWTLCIRSCSLISDEVTQELTPLSYKILCFFIKNPNRIISRDEFVNSVWSNHYVDDNAINKAISDLRRMLKTSDDIPNVIKTHYKKGYSFNSEINLVREERRKSDENKSIINTLSSTGSDEDLNRYDENLLPTKQFVTNTTLFKPNENLRKFIKSKYFYVAILFLSLSFLFIFWWHSQPKLINLKSKKLSISNSIYYSLSLSPLNDKLAITKKNQKTNIDEIFFIDLETYKNTKVISENFDSYPIGWVSNSNSFFYQIINNDKNFCEVWRADFSVSNDVANKEKVFDCDSQYVLSIVTDEANNRIIYTKFGYRGVPSLSALVSRELSSGIEFQVTSPSIDSAGDRYLSLASDKEKIAFVRLKSGKSQIFIANKDGSIQKLVYETDGIIRRLNWGNDSKSLSWFLANSKKLITLNIENMEVNEKNIVTNDFLNVLIPFQNKYVGTTRYSDYDLYSFNNSSLETKKLLDSKANEFQPIRSENGFYFFQQDTDIKLFSYFDNKIQNLNLTIKLNKVRTSSLNIKSNLFAVASRDKILLIDLKESAVIGEHFIREEIIDFSWFSDNELLLILKEDNNDQHIWLYNLNTEIKQKLVHKNANKVFSDLKGGIYYQDFYNNIYIFDKDEGHEKELLSLSNFPYVKWQLIGEKIYFTNGENIFKQVIGEKNYIEVFNNSNDKEKFISDFSVIEKAGKFEFIIQFQVVKSNSVILLK